MRARIENAGFRIGSEQIDHSVDSLEERALPNVMCATSAGGERLAAAATAIESRSSRPIGVMRVRRRGFGSRHQNARRALGVRVHRVGLVLRQRHARGGPRGAVACAKQLLPGASARQSVPRLVVLEERQLPLVQRSTPPPIRTTKQSSQSDDTIRYDTRREQLSLTIDISAEQGVETKVQ